jgi:RHS repeat-associated protein
MRQINVPLHEWTETEREPLIDIITWVFEDGTFVPTARITDRGSESIVTDYLGTPNAMFDGEGNKTWEADLDIYGRVRTFVGRSLNECPFRYQGQYEDSETGLYYNRFRYYDPGSGRYLSQDPIGINGDRTNFYVYVKNPNKWLDILGLQGVFSDELASMARDVHNLAGNNQIAINQSTVAIARADVNGESVLFASGSDAYLNPAQRKRLIELGVPEENIFSGSRYKIQGDAVNHAERVIERNLPIGSEVSEWGISWGSKQKNEMCPKCEAHFGHSH